MAWKYERGSALKQRAIRPGPECQPLKSDYKIAPLRTQTAATVSSSAAARWAVM